MSHKDLESEIDRKKLYQLMDGFLVESSNRTRTLDELNRDRHLFIDNLLQYLAQLLQDAQKSFLKEVTDAIVRNSREIEHCNDEIVNNTGSLLLAIHELESPQHLKDDKQDGMEVE